MKKNIIKINTVKKKFRGKFLKKIVTTTILIMILNKISKIISDRAVR